MKLHKDVLKSYLGIAIKKVSWLHYI